MRLTKKDIYGDDYVGLTKLTDQVYLGGCLEACDTKLLQEAGVTAVINLTHENYDTDQSVFKYFQLWQDDRCEIPDHKIKQFIDWMDKLVDGKEVVFVHCMAGISRTPSFVIAWMMHRAGANAKGNLKAMWSRYEDQIGRVRSIIAPHFLLKASVLRYFGWSRDEYQRQIERLFGSR